MITIPAWILWMALGLGVGAGGVVGVQALTKTADPAETVAEVGAVVEQVQAPELMEAETKQIVASMDAASIAVTDALKDDAKPSDVALAMYALAVQGAMAKEEGASALEVKMAAEALVKTIDEMDQGPPPVLPLIE
jgi:hypothetical protein